MQLSMTLCACFLALLLLQVNGGVVRPTATPTPFGWCEEFECCEDIDCPERVHCEVVDIIDAGGAYFAEEVGVCVQDDYCNGDISSEGSEYGWQPGWTMEEQFTMDDDLSGAGGVQITADDMADGCVEQALPFPFPFFGTNRLTVWACVEGFLQFSTSDPGVDSSYTCPLTDEGPRIVAFHGNLDFFYYYYYEEFKRGHGAGLAENIFYAESTCTNPRNGLTQQCVHFQWNAVTDCSVGVCYVEGEPGLEELKRGHGDTGQFEIDVTLYADGTIGILVTNRDASHFSTSYSMGLTSGDGSVVEFVCEDDSMIWQSFLAYPRDSYERDCLGATATPMPTPMPTATPTATATPGGVFMLDFTEASFHFMSSTTDQEERP